MASHGKRAIAAPAALAGLLLAACSAERVPRADRFDSTGELIAMSGAGAGATGACFTCHGLDGRGDGAGVPRLAGLPPGYLQSQLQAYADGRRRHPEMGWIASRLTPTQRLLVAQHYAAMPLGTLPSAGSPPAIYARGDPNRGIPSCVSCHGLDAEAVSPAVPPLAGQPAGYLAEQIDRWRTSQRRNDPDGVMLRISRALTEREIAALELYWARADRARRGSAEESRGARRSGPRSDASARRRYAPAPGSSGPRP